MGAIHSRSRGKRKWIVLLFVLLVLLSGVVGLLLTFSRISPRRMPLQFEPTLPGDLAPGDNYVMDAGTMEERRRIHRTYSFNVNSLGFRGTEPDCKGEDCQWKMLILGDGFAFGYGINAGEPFSEKLTQIIKANYPDLVFAVFNAALPGYTITDELSYMEEKGANLEPNVVVLVIASDDVWQMKRPFSVRDLSRRIAANRLYVLKLLYYKLTGQTYFIIEQDRRRTRQEVQQQYDSLLSKYMTYVSKLNQMIATWGGKLVAITERVEFPSLEHQFKKAGIPLIVLNRLIQGLDRRKSLGPAYTLDGHWAPQTHTRIANILFKFLRENGLLNP